MRLLTYPQLQFETHLAIPQQTSHLQVTIDKLYGYAIMGVFGGYDFSRAAPLMRPRPAVLLIPHSSPASLLPSPIICPITPFKINTCTSLSKQITSTPFRINTYEKPGERGALSLTRYPMRISVLSERSESKELSQTRGSGDARPIIASRSHSWFPWPLGQRNAHRISRYN